MAELSTDRRGFLSVLLGGSAAALAVDARIAPDIEEQAALARIDAWIVLGEQQEQLIGTYAHLAFLDAHPAAGLITAQLFRDLMTAIRYAMKANSGRS